MGEERRRDTWEMRKGGREMLRVRGEREEEGAAGEEVMGGRGRAKEDTWHSGARVLRVGGAGRGGLNEKEGVLL